MFVGIAKIEFIKRIENIGLGLNVDPVRSAIYVKANKRLGCSERVDFVFVCVPTLSPHSNPQVPFQNEIKLDRNLNSPSFEIAG